MVSGADFRWDEYFWVTTVQPADERLARKAVELVFAPEGRGDEPLTAGELALVNSVIDRIGEILDAAVSGLHDAYPRLQELYDYGDDERAQYMPDVASTEGIRHLVELTSLNVHPVTLGGEPYVGVVFDCPWDVEHGVGILMSETRVVEIGGADSAVLLWIAERDIESSDQ